MYIYSNEQLPEPGSSADYRFGGCCRGNVGGKWDLDDIGFKRRRTQAARDTADQKVKLSTDPGAALNYAEQTNLVGTRVVRDLLDAMSRVRAAVKGLKSIYNLDAAVPKVISDIIEGKNQTADVAEALEKLVEWIRNCLTNVLRFSQKDQSYTLAIAIKASVEPDIRSKGQHAEKWLLNIKKELFPKQCHVRVRGINMFVRGTVGV